MLLQISWIRLRDWHILTNGMLTYTSDSRFQVLHKEGSYDWVLQIKFVQERDAGHYECQVKKLHQQLLSAYIISESLEKSVINFMTIDEFELFTDEIEICLHLLFIGCFKTNPGKPKQ